MKRMSSIVHPRTALEDAQLKCAAALVKLEPLFHADCRLTLLMRTPGDDEAEILITRDDIPAVIESLQRFQKREPS